MQQQVQAQKYTTRGLNDEYELVNQRLQAQQSLAETKIENALSNYSEAPVQIQAATNAYLQKSVLYTNGLATIVELPRLCTS